MGVTRAGGGARGVRMVRVWRQWGYGGGGGMGQWGSGEGVGTEGAGGKRVWCGGCGPTSPLSLAYCIFGCGNATAVIAAPRHA